MSLFLLSSGWLFTGCLAPIPLSPATAPAPVLHKVQPGFSLAPEVAGDLKAPAPTSAAAVGESARLVASGATGLAAKTLRDWLAGYELSEGAERVGLELERVESFRALRDKVVAQIMAKGKKLNVVLPAGKIIATIESLEDGVMHLGRNRLKLDVLAVDDVPSREWCRLMFDRKKWGLEPDPAMLLGLAVHGEAALEDAPKRFDIPKEWSAAARDEYPRARRDAELQAALVLLSEKPDSRPADELIDAVGALMAPGPLASEEMALQVDELVADIRKVALERLAAAYRGRPLAELLSAKVTEGKGGMVTLLWDFESEDQIRDFRPDSPFLLSGRRKEVQGLSLDDPFHIAGGQLVGSGAASLVSLVQLEAVKADWSVYIEDEAAGVDLVFELVLNLTKSTDYVSASTLRGISIVRDGEASRDEGALATLTGTTILMALHRTKKGWDLTHEDETVVSSKRKAPKKGRIAITNSSAAGRSIEYLEVSGYMRDEERAQLAVDIALRDAKEWGWLE